MKQHTPGTRLHISDHCKHIFLWVFASLMTGCQSEAGTAKKQGALGQYCFAELTAVPCHALHSHGTAVQKLAKCKSKLEEQIAQGVDLYKKLEQESLLNQGLTSKLDNKTSELQFLQTELLQKQHDINRFNSHIDELELKVDRLERIGQDLLTYSGGQVQMQPATNNLGFCLLAKLHHQGG